MSHGGTVKVQFYLGLKPKVSGGPTNTHVRQVTSTKTWNKPPSDPGEYLVIPIELEVPEEAFIPTMPHVNISIPLESLDAPEITTTGGIKRIDVTKAQKDRGIT